jgi:hypothetical protein
MSSSYVVPVPGSSSRKRPLWSVRVWCASLAKETLGRGRPSRVSTWPAIAMTPGGLWSGGKDCHGEGPRSVRQPGPRPAGSGTQRSSSVGGAGSSGRGAVVKVIAAGATTRPVRFDESCDQHRVGCRWLQLDRPQEDQWAIEQEEPLPDASRADRPDCVRDPTAPPSRRNALARSLLAPAGSDRPGPPADVAAKTKGD